MSTEIIDAYIAPVSHAQRRLWFLQRLAPDSVVYNIPAAARFCGPVDVSRIERALNSIVERHDALRTTFAVEDGAPVQVVQAFKRSTLPVRSVAEREVNQALVEEAGKPFDLAAGPLFRAVLFPVADQENILLLTMHHIIADGWSMNLLLREFTHFYRGDAVGNASPAPELPIQFSDFVEWQNALLTETEQQERLEAWRRHLDGTPLVLDLPADFPRPADQSYRGGTFTRVLPPVLSDQLRHLARRENVTLFMLLLAVFETLLARCSRQVQFLIGTPVAGRSHPDTEALVGFFVNTLVLRADLQGDPTFAQLLQMVRAECLQAFGRDEIQFERIVDAVQPARDRSRTPLFQTYFTLQSGMRQSLNLPGLVTSLVDVDLQTAKVDLTLEMEETPAGLLARWTYVRDLFTEDTATRWAGLFENLCGAVVSDASRRISLLPMLSEEQRTELVRGGAALADFATDEPLHVWFHRIAAHFSERTALTDGDQRITYAELDRRSNQVANLLSDLHIGPESLVAICLPRSSDLLISILGVLKAGAAYVPMDPAYPTERIEFMLADSGVSAVLTRQELPLHTRANVIDLGSVEAVRQDPLTVAVDPDHAAYVIYTSGSTGKPKGCVVTHGNVTRLMRSTERCFGFGSDDVWTLFHSFAFDFSVWEIWGALLYGGRLVVVPYQTSREPELFYRMLAQERVTVLNQTPSAFRQLMAVDAEMPLPLSLRYVIFGGEALELGQLRLWMDRHGDGKPQLVNMYGITETTVHVTYRRITRADVDAGKGSLIGVPLPDLSLHVVDSHLQPVPIGVPGEIVVGGAGLARGYLHRPELTAERFVPNPFAPGRWYRSGDLARRLPDGGVEYLGRIDQQVKIRGFRIELGEIEKVLSRAGAVREALVVASGEGVGEKRLIAYLTARAGEPIPTVPELRDLCREWLPDYMIPSAFMFLQSLPLTSHGKVDRAALPAPVSDAAAVASYQQPETRAEVELARIWERVLGVTRVGKSDNFFALGGDSILTIQVVSQARKVGLQLSPKDLFERQTLGDLARAVQIIGDEASTPNASAISPETRQHLLATGVHFADAYPLVPMQAGMLFQALLEPERDVYFEQVSGEITGPLVPGAFRAAWQGLLDRHPALRTSFVWKEVKEPVQVVHQQVSLDWTAVDWTEAEGTEAEWTHLLAADRRRGFVFDQAPLWRVTLVRLGKERWRWLWSHFHALLDGWCLPLVFADVLADYEYLANGSGARPPKGLPYRPYVDWVAAQDRNKAERYWRETLAGFQDPPPLQLPKPDLSKRAPEDRCELRLSLDESTRLREWARRQNLTLNSVLQGAWSLLLNRYGLGKDIVFGATVAGRPAELAGVEKTIGLFINTLPLRVLIDPGAEVIPWLQVLQQSQARAREFEYTPLSDVQGWSDVPRGQSLFETILVFENYPGDELLRAVNSSLQLSNFQTEERTNYLLTAAVLPGQQIALRLHFDPTRIDSAAASGMLDGWHRAVQALAGSTGLKLGGLDLLDPDHTEKLRSWSAGPQRSTRQKTVVEIIARHAERDREAPALLGPGCSVSYGELITRATELARGLQASGVALETPVAVCLEKSPELVIAWLGVLIAGGAFLPLDPQFASARLMDIISDARPLVLLAHRRTSQVAISVRLPVLWVDDVRSGFQARSGDRISGNNLAYIIYTSGSTGKPKGVMLTHEGLTNLAMSQAEICGLGPGRRGLQFASVSFDAAVSEVFMALVSGASIWLEERDAVPDPAAFAALVERAQIDHATLPPALLQALSPERFPGIRTLLIAGEAASEAVFRAWSAGRQVFNAYGPTETTVCASMEEVSDSIDRVTLGRPLKNLTVHVVDGDLNLVPPGIPGEIAVGGIGVARGYLGRPDLTAQSFVPDPFSVHPGARLYRTGDRGRWTQDGRVEFLGRADRQVKIRGFRVEPAEVEAALRSHPGVADALVIGQKADSRGSYLAAYVLTKPSTHPQSAELTEHLRAKLPAYLLPKRITVLPSWPLTPAGKVDLRALEGMEQQAHSPTKFEWIDKTEQTLACIWADVLHAPVVSPMDNFFELGGDSILSLQIVARAHQAGLQFTPRELFQNPTVRGLAAIAQRSVGNAEAAAEAEYADIPLTPIQHWFFDQQQPDPNHWNQSLVLEIRNSAFANGIEEALRAVVGRHPAFGYRFQRDQDGKWNQTTESGLTQSALKLERYLDADLLQVTGKLQAAIDLTSGPLIRAALFTRSTGDNPLLFLAIHHLIVDGVSWRILAEDLARACQLVIQKQPVVFPPATARMSEWAQALLRDAALPVRAAEFPYWRAMAGHTSDLPSDFSAALTINNAANAQVVSEELDQDTTSALLRDAHAAYNLNTNELLLAALARTLSAWSGNASHVISLEGHGREELSEPVDTSRTVGWFTTIFPFRLESPDGADDRALLVAVKEALRAVPGKGIGFGMLRYLSPDPAIREQLAAIRTPRISFNYLGQTDQTLGPDAPFALASVESGSGLSPRATRVHWIDVNAMVSGGRLKVDWIYCENIHRRAGIEALCTSFLMNVRQLVDHCLHPEAGAYTPSDFGLADLTFGELDAVLADLEETVGHEGNDA